MIGSRVRDEALINEGNKRANDQNQAAYHL